MREHTKQREKTRKRHERERFALSNRQKQYVPSEISQVISKDCEEDAESLERECLELKQQLEMAELEVLELTELEKLHMNELRRFEVERKKHKRFLEENVHVIDNHAGNIPSFQKLLHLEKAEALRTCGSVRERVKAEQRAKTMRALAGKAAVKAATAIQASHRRHEFGVSQVTLCAGVRHSKLLSQHPVSNPNEISSI